MGHQNQACEVGEILQSIHIKNQPSLEIYWLSIHRSNQNTLKPNWPGQLKAATLR
jgi:hypothetical protein